MGTDDREERKRVYGRIAPLVLAFAKDNSGSTFHANDLRRFVIGRAPEIAPNSPYRILWELKQEGKLDYVVLNRRQSLYQFRPPKPHQLSLFD